MFPIIVVYYLQKDYNTKIVTKTGIQDTSSQYIGVATMHMKIGRVTGIQVNDSQCTWLATTKIRIFVTGAKYLFKRNERQPEMDQQNQKDAASQIHTVNIIVKTKIGPTLALLALGFWITKMLFQLLPVFT